VVKNADNKTVGIGRLRSSECQGVPKQAQALLSCFKFTVENLPDSDFLQAGVGRCPIGGIEA
jgi:hypothetical protein